MRSSIGKILLNLSARKKRVEDFQYMYTVSKVITTATFVITIFAFWFTKSVTLQSISIALHIFGISSLVIDFFSEERAKIYYEMIVQALEGRN